jgi:hypothetical protein
MGAALQLPSDWIQTIIDDSDPAAISDWRTGDESLPEDIRDTFPEKLVFNKFFWIPTSLEMCHEYLLEETHHQSANLI